MLDCLPRAIVLAASQLRNPDLNDLLRRARAERERVLRDPHYPDEIKSVALGFQLAYERLRQRDPRAAAFYPALALFPGGVGEDGVAAIFGDRARDWVASIEDQSLLERLYPGARMGDTPLDLLYLPTPLRFFAERLADPAAESNPPSLSNFTSLQTLHGDAALRYYFALPDEPHVGHVSRLDNLLLSSGEAMGALIARYAAELPSIEAWLDWGYAGESCRDAVSRSARLTALLQNLYVVTDLLPQRRERLQAALQAARRCADVEGEANALKALGDLKARVADLAGAWADYGAALPIYREIKSRLGEANVLQALGDLKARVDDLAGARADYGAALTIYREIKSRLGEANALQALGDLARAQGDYQQAWTHLRAALALHSQIQAKLGMTADYVYMARTARAAGQPVLAVALADEALSLFRAIGDRWGEMLALRDQGAALSAIEQRVPAFAAWWLAREHARVLHPGIAQQLDSLFAQIEQAAGADEWSQLEARLRTDAEALRAEGVAAARKRLESQGNADALADMA